LSHWPGTPTPEELWADLSAEIVLEALARPDLLPAGVDLASIDHYDTDGVISLALLCDESLAHSHGQLLVEAARVGDFDVVMRRDAALVAFALGALLDVGCFAEEPSSTAGSRPGLLEQSARAVGEALRILPGLASDPWSHEALWHDEAAAFDAATGALVDGWASIQERPDHDLAVVRVDVGHPDASAAAWDGAPLHRAAVHSATEQLRVATMAGDRLEVRYRYESWVRLMSRRPRPRVDLSAAAHELTRAEPDATPWVFDGAGAITPALHPVGDRPSGLSPEEFLDIVGRQLEALDGAEPAWDPYPVLSSS
jgi:hypothetical protein